MKILGIAGYSGSGKTTLIEALIPLLSLHGLVVSVIKRAHHGFDVDKPGKDSWRHRQAGAQEVMLASPERWVLMRELRRDPEENLDNLLSRLSPCDLVLVEGFKAAPIPKIEVWRPANGKPALHPEIPSVVAVATDGDCAAALPILDLNDTEAVARFIVDALPGLPQAGRGSR
ncbi:MAG: molybdopterin-guanine dinucleotide biosynthesis protein B [Rhodocyclaceae bacterium]|nr:molybdopterin-guanine dinucleotide biosynthesis protein B [Rhodocyclaceae bacterium]